MIQLPPSSTLFPYTTLFRSQQHPEESFHRSPLQRTQQRPQLTFSEGFESPIDAALSRGLLDQRLVERAHRLARSEEHTSELQSQSNLVCRLLLEKKKNRDSK